MRTINKIQTERTQFYIWYIVCGDFNSTNVRRRRHDLLFYAEVQFCCRSKFSRSTVRKMMAHWACGGQFNKQNSGKNVSNCQGWDCSSGKHHRIVCQRIIFVELQSLAEEMHSPRLPPNPWFNHLVWSIEKSFIPACSCAMLIHNEKLFLLELIFVAVWKQCAERIFA